MKESFSIRFYIHPIKIKDSKHQIYTRIIVEREKVELATKLWINPKQWNVESGRAKKDLAINDDIAEIENAIRSVRRKILDDGKKLSAK